MLQWSQIERRLTEKEVGKGGKRQFVGSVVLDAAPVYDGTILS